MPTSQHRGAELYRDSCPECGSDLYNGQGIRACLDCDWTARLDR